MKSNIGAFAAIVLLIVSCKPTPDQEKVSDESKYFSQPLSCYVFVKEDDSVSLNFEVDKNIVTGELTYNFFEKDDNRGTIEGKMHGDTLFATYTFQSEGTTSEREVAFLRKGDAMVEGFGEITQEAGKTVFKNRKRLYFESNLVLEQMACQ